MYFISDYQVPEKKKYIHEEVDLFPLRNTNYT